MQIRGRIAPRGAGGFGRGVRMDYTQPLPLALHAQRKRLVNRIIHAVLDKVVK